MHAIHVAQMCRLELPDLQCSFTARQRLQEFWNMHTATGACAVSIFGVEAAAPQVTLPKHPEGKSVHDFSSWFGKAGRPPACRRGTGSLTAGCGADAGERQERGDGPTTQGPQC